MAWGLGKWQWDLSSGFFNLIWKVTKSVTWCQSYQFLYTLETYVLLKSVLTAFGSFSLPFWHSSSLIIQSVHILVCSQAHYGWTKQSSWCTKNSYEWEDNKDWSAQWIKVPSGLEAWACFLTYIKGQHWYRLNNLFFKE